MKVYKGKLMTALFQAFCGICAGLFVFNLTGRLTHSLIISTIAAVVVVLLILCKVFVTDFISVVLTDDGRFLVRRFNKIIKNFVIDDYYWAEYPVNSNTKDAEDQDIYYVCKKTGEEDYIDCSNFDKSDYDEILTLLGAKKTETSPVKVETIKN